MASTMSECPTNILDHLVYITPPGSLDSTINAFQELGFQ